MKLKLLLFVLFVSCGLFSLRVQAQYDTIKYLVISETRQDNMQYTYAEISNRSETQAVDLSQFEFGNLTSWDLPYRTSGTHNVRLPNHILWPGESWVLGDVYDLPIKMMKKDPEHWTGRTVTQDDMWGKINFQVNPLENSYGDFTHTRLADGTVLDSVSPGYDFLLEDWAGRDCWFLRQHFSATDSVVTDAVNGDFSDPNRPGYHVVGPVDVAGKTNGTGNSVLVRKYSVKEGNTNWEQQKGVDLTDSEWMPLPLPTNGWGPIGNKVWSYWTVGNDGNYTLSADNFVSSTATIDWADTVITVPWGTLNQYKVMNLFEKTPGLAWQYGYSSNKEDSAFTSCRTGDVLTIYACGNELQIWPFHIVVAEPTAGANVVAPKNHINFSGRSRGLYSDNAYFQVTENAPGMDTLWNMGYATPVDTIFKYLEKAPEASWKIVYGDNVTRPDVMTGDMLEVTAKNGDVKDYYIKTNIYYPNHDASLASITWPDIPDLYRGIFGWKGDTIPGFSSNTYSYDVSVPADVDGIPELTASPSQRNTTFTVDRATNILGTLADRTIKFKAAAEDDSTQLTYNVVLTKEKPHSDIQPFVAEPFISQRTVREWWGGSAMEIYNPGNQPLDLSHYLLLRDEGQGGTPASAITFQTTVDDWGNRYNKYIPGRRWQDEAQWQVTPYLAVPDIVVNPVIQGHGCFVVADIGVNSQGQYPSNDLDPAVVNIDFRNNPWGDTTVNGGMGGNPVLGWQQSTYYLFKILNDSVINGTKPVGDPNDFQVIDIFGNGDGTIYTVGTSNWDQVMKYERKEYIWHGNTQYGNYGGSFGTDDDNCEWYWWNRSKFDIEGHNWPEDVAAPMLGLGSHTMDPVTFYMSTITSTIYKVSQGYSMNESVRGATTGTTVDQFIANINKADTAQTLTFTSGGTELSGSDALTDGDLLTVKSADGKNTSAYTIEVTDSGLSHDAMLTSDTYDITVQKDGSMGTISGFDYTTLLSAVKDGVVVPAGASMTIIDQLGRYVPLKMLSNDTTYVDVTANSETYFEVVAEDGVTSIMYQLMPNATTSDAYVTSSFFMVDQQNSIIMNPTTGMTPSTLLSYLVPAPGATMKLVDKGGFERTTGHINVDDKVVVTASDGVTQRVYFLSMLLIHETEGQMAGDYLAFVTSDVYSVDQLNYTIAAGSMELAKGDANATFLGNLIPSTGATIAVVNADGVETTDPLTGGDMLKVTAANGETVVMYQITMTAVKQLTTNNLNLYPNPTVGEVNITGLTNGNRIRVFNMTGSMIRSFEVNSDKATFSLQNEPAGMYFITVNNAEQNVGSFKVIKK